MKLDEIYKPIKRELDTLDKVLRKELDSSYPFLSRLSRYILSSPGKLLRPALVFLSSRAVGSRDVEKSVNLAAAIEIIHTATLIHDDIIDKGIYRRGKETVNVKWGNNISILFGDYLFSTSFRLLSHLNIPIIFSYLTSVTNRICEGEMKQLRMTFRRNMSEEDYLEIIEKKTASLMSASCKTAAILAEAKGAQIKGLEEFGRNFGIAYQIIDDCQDLIGDEKDVGKTLGMDLEQGKSTLPIIYLMHSKKKLESQQAVEKALGKARGFIKKAKERLSVLEDSIFKNSLINLTDFIVERIP